ncbi:DUF1616 domain-containing protein [Haloglomus litoreum]|uniref:DUF1616 domain-containing protein n=1 Tax=Haloglomus litoreum TaxID=3034026 RepID=UPI0023E80882|nr:DUF1616 domain-containing protein [Haloglomus sp. DT116]
MQSLRHPPGDLLAATVLTAVAAGIVLAVPPQSAGLRLLSGTVLLVFLPGYALVAAAFPGWRAVPVGGVGTHGDDRRRASIRELAERLALSVGAGVAVVPLLALALDVLGIGLGLVPAVVGLSTVVLVGLALAVARRWALPAPDRFRAGIWAWLGTLRPSASESRASVALNVLLALSVVAALASLGGALAFPIDGERYTDFALRTEGADGGLVAGGYPEELALGANETLIATVENHERARANYTVVVQLQRVRRDGDGIRVIERRELTRATQSLAPGERWRHEHTIRAEGTDMAGPNRRLTYLLYRESAPTEPRVSTAYRSLRLWVDVVG